MGQVTVPPLGGGGWTREGDGHGGGKVLWPRALRYYTRRLCPGNPLGRHMDQSLPQPGTPWALGSRTPAPRRARRDGAAPPPLQPPPGVHPDHADRCALSVLWRCTRTPFCSRHPFTHTPAFRLPPRLGREQPRSICTQTSATIPPGGYQGAPHTGEGAAPARLHACVHVLTCVCVCVCACACVCACVCMCTVPWGPPGARQPPTRGLATAWAASASVQERPLRLIIHPCPEIAKADGETRSVVAGVGEARGTPPGKRPTHVAHEIASRHPQSLAGAPPVWERAERLCRPLMWPTRSPGLPQSAEGTPHSPEIGRAYPGTAVVPLHLRPIWPPYQQAAIWCSPGWGGGHPTPCHQRIVLRMGRW